MDSPVVSIIIVNWNGRHLLPDCLGSLAKISYKNTEIFFVDNASKDESVSYVKKYYPRIKIILNSKNLGYAEGNEVGFKNSKGEAILILNTDTIVEKNLLDALGDTLYSASDIGAVQPKIVMYPQTNLIDSIGSFFLMNGDLYHYGREKDPRLSMYNKEMDIFSAKGACILLRREMLEKTGLFDKDYFAYFEDTDLSMRIWLSGYRIVYTPKTTVYHKGGATAKQVVSSYIQFHSYKNRLCTYIKNLSFKYLCRVMPLTIIIYESASILYIVKRKVDISWAIQKAIFWNITHIKQTLQKRKHIKRKIRVVKDDNFLPKLTRRVRLSYYYYQFFGGIERYRD